MIVKLKRNPNEKEVKKLINFLNEQNVRVDETVGDRYTIISLIGDTSSIDEKLISRFDIVDKVIRIEEPFSKANKKNHPQPKIVDVDGVKIGDGNFCVMAGPCSVESEEQIITIAKSVKENGANILRGWIISTMSICCKLELEICKIIPYLKSWDVQINQYC